MHMESLRRFLEIFLASVGESCTVKELNHCSFLFSFS